MAHYRVPHPYDAHFALPDNVVAEPPGRGTLTTHQRPRKSFEARPADMPPAWSAHFDIPSYIVDEPEGRGSMHSYWARRKTIPILLPDSLGSLGNDMLEEQLGLWPFDKISDAAKAVGRGVKKASVTVYKGGKKIVYDIPKSVHCKLASSQIGTMGAGAIGKYYGVPPEVAMAVHTGFNEKVCGEKYYPKPTPAPLPKPAPPFGGQIASQVLGSKWTLPVVGLGVAGLAVYLITRK